MAEDDQLKSEYIWTMSPLDFAAADRILRTPRLALTVQGTDYQDLCTALAAVALLAFEAAIQPQWPVGLGPLIIKAYVNLVDGVFKAVGFPGAPPVPPASWMKEMNAWIQAAADSHVPTPRGARPKTVDHILYPKLLGIYSIAYGKAPASTSGGPTERFIAAFLDTLAKVARTVKFDGDEAVVSAISNPVTIFTSPTSAALCKRVREFLPQSEERLVREMMRHFSGDPRLPLSN